jgi:hypothetical protein
MPSQTLSLSEIENRCAKVAFDTYRKALKRRRSEVIRSAWDYENIFDGIFPVSEWNTDKHSMLFQAIVAVFAVVVLSVMGLLMVVFGLLKTSTDLLRLSWREVFGKPLYPASLCINLSELWRNSIPADDHLVRFTPEEQLEILASWLEIIGAPSSQYSASQLASRANSIRRGIGKSSAHLRKEGITVSFVPPVKVLVKQISDELGQLYSI